MNASPVAAGQSLSSESNSELLAVMQRDLGLTSQQATARLAKEAWASTTESALRSELGSTFAGAWLSADATELMVGVTDSTQMAEVTAAGATPKLMKYGMAQLNAAKARLDSASRVNTTIAGWYVDVSTNRLVVVAQPQARAAARALVARAGVSRAAVRVVTAEESPQLLFDVRGADPFIINRTARCSIGFAVVGGFVSAGHCGSVGDVTQLTTGAAQGTFAASSFPGDDFSFVEVNDDAVLLGVVNNFEGENLPVEGSTEAPVGASICRSGSTTGTECGVIQAKNATVNYPEGTVTGLTRTNVCAEAGDSGGPWLSGTQAQGVTSGGSGDCTTGGITFFQPLTEILEVNDLTLVTSDGAEDPPTASPTAEPTEEPTAEPTEEPTAEPTEEPTAEPTQDPTAEPTDSATEEPPATEEPTAEPTYSRY